MNSFPLNLHSTEPDSFVRTSNDAVKTIKRAIDMRNGLKSLSNLFKYPAMLVVFPAGYLFVYISIWVYNRRLSKACSEKIHLGNYRQLREELLALDELTNKLKSVRVVPAPQKKTPWYLVPLMRQILKMGKTIKAYHASIKKQVDVFDEPISPMPNGWKLVTGTEMFEARVKGYEYLI
ncbi:MAG: hypothetical protein JNL02_01710 [Saprospiraceae bacterium]|nr:hypothetical protein [Saprospiraceae bacterium]